MKKLKNFIGTFIFIGTIYCIYFYYNDIKNFFVTTVDNIIYKSAVDKIIIPENNQYKLNYTFSYVSDVDDYTPHNISDIKNIIFSILNNGWDKFTFICPREYKECIEDSLTITNDNVILSDINNFVHPYNTFNKIETSYNSNGLFNIKVEKNYTDEMISEIENKVINIISANVNNSMSDVEKIRTIHDYIINNTKYDKDYADGRKYYSSNTAYGAILQGNSICSGYADAMSIFLNKLNIPNYRISSIDHIWNLVYIEGAWKHLDLTFDDPVTNTNRQVLDHDYFLINTQKLHSLDLEEHLFNSSTFIEAN